MKTLTIFTPTYNRASTLIRSYEALCRQTVKGFKWLIIDDGSTDNTKELVTQWMNADNGFPISYVYKKNGGLHTGYNKAIELIDTELCVCIDSDDFMPDDAVEHVLTFWEEYRDESLAGFIGLDYCLNGEPIGGLLPEVESLHIVELTEKYHHYGDTKMVLRTSLLKAVSPQPTLCGEKNFNPIYLMLLVDQKYPFKTLNKNLCFVEYQDSGMSRNIFKQYKDSPNSFAALRLISMKSPKASFFFKLKQHVHFVAEIILAKNLGKIKESPNLFLSLLTLPIGGVLALYIEYKTSKK